MATGSDNLEVDIEDERYSPLSVSEEYCALVRKQRDSFNVEQFVEYIGHVGNFIKIAYNGVNAAGPKFTDLQIKVQRLGYEIITLYDHSSVTINRFQATASTVSSRLESMYQFLLDGSDDSAVATVTSLNELAKEMVKIALKLKEKFEEQEKNVEDILETAKTTKNVEKKCNWEQLEKEQEEMKQKMQEQKKLADRYDLVREEKKERMKYKTKEEKEIEGRSDGRGLFDIVADAILTVMFPFAAEAMDDALHRDEGESAEKKKSLEDIAEDKREIKLQQQNLHHEVLQKMHEFASKFKNVKSENEMFDIAIEALHKTSGALRQLSIIMTKASMFWIYIQDRCNSLSDKNFKDLMGLLNLKDEETKKKFWRGEEFITESEAYKLRWLALDKACEEYKKLIDAARADLLEYIKDNPTYEQSLQRLPQLTQNFMEILDKAKNEIEQKKRQQLTDH